MPLKFCRSSRACRRRKSTPWGFRFNTPDPDMFETLAKYNVYGVEMEAAGIYAIAAENNAEALAICTVSDDIVSGA